MLKDSDLASKITEKQVDNIINCWGDTGLDMKNFNDLQELTGNKKLSMAILLNRKAKRSKDEITIRNN